MSWLYSQAVVEASLEENFWDGVALAQWKKKSIKGQFYSSGKMTDCYLLSRFGMTLRPSQLKIKNVTPILPCSKPSEINCAFPVVSHAKIFRWRERARELMASGAAYGGNFTGSFARYDPHAHCWKTPQLSLIEDLRIYSAPFPKWGIMQCGACTVHLNGEATRSCMLPVSAIGTAKVTTIEGLSATGNHPVQRAWDEVDVPQCGYCQAGQIMTAAAFLKRNPKPTVAEIDATMSGNICRCGTYHRIRQAVQLASTKK